MRESALKLHALLARTRSEEWLFSRALGGDAVAFSEVYRRYRGVVYGFCLSRVLDHSVAEEAAQETFVRFLNADSSSIVSLRPWLFGVARNVCLEMSRDHLRAELVADTEYYVGSTHDSHEELCRRDQGRHIILALRRMRPRYRTALVLRELHGLSSAEMAEALDTTPGAVDTLVCRAREAFGRTYAEVCDLPAECAAVFPLIYKSIGHGLDADETARVEHHLADCPTCSRESKWAEKGVRLSAVIPLLTPLGEAGELGPLAQLLASLNPYLASLPYGAIPLTHHLWVRSAALVLAAVSIMPVTSSMVADVDLGFRKANLHRLEETPGALLVRDLRDRVVTAPEASPQESTPAGVQATSPHDVKEQAARPRTLAAAKGKPRSNTRAGRSSGAKTARRASATARKSAARAHARRVARAHRAGRAASKHPVRKTAASSRSGKVTASSAKASSAKAKAVRARGSRWMRR